MAIARLVELGKSNRNIGSHPHSREGDWSRRLFPAIVALHTAVIAGTAAFGTSKPRLRWLALLVAMQPLRWWVLATLDKRWNARGAVPRQMKVATDGPYTFVRHPNYSVVAIELATLPSTFGLHRLAVVATLINAALLTLRVQEEEALLFQLPGYGEHFSNKPRFVPGLF
jgi:methyltransferase